MTTRWPLRDEGGFVMIMVVMLMFAVAVAGATGYQLVAAEADLASGAEESQVALAAARAGLERFVGEHIGVPADTTTYVIADAEVYVMTRRTVHYASPMTPDVYMVEAVAELADERHPEAPARRTVRQYARLHKWPVNVKGAITTTATSVTTNTPVSGTDASLNGSRGSSVDTAGVCRGSGPTSLINLNGVTATTNTGSGSVGPTGSPLARQGLTSAAAVLDTLNVRWSVLESPSFPIPFTGSMPNFGSLPSDSFPVVRMTGDYTASGIIEGQGVLIVPGTFAVGSEAGFRWDGLILAGSVATTTVGLFSAMQIEGALVAGLDGAQATFTVGGPFMAATIRNNSCNLAKANRALAYLELIDGTRWEF